MQCRHCQHKLEYVFLDLGFAPPSNAYLSAGELQMPEMTFPLKLFVCDQCWLVQTQDFSRADELFRADYAYYSSTSKSWLDHAARYCAMITGRLGLGKDSLVIEIASNDGYLLKNFVASGIPCLGIEPTAGTAQAARALGIDVLEVFFGEEEGARLTKAGQSADLIIGNNVYAHVPDINDFTKGMKAALKPGGTITLEFPHLLELITHNQFDTAYHEHFSYLSLIAVSWIFAEAGLRVFDVELLPTHGGSLRVYGCHDCDARPTEASVTDLVRREEKAGLRDTGTYLAFQARADKVKNDFVAFLIEQKRKGRKVAGYGAAAKGNTLMNYAGIRPDLVSFVCDAAVAKQNKYLPGSHIPVLSPSAIDEQKPDIIVIFPWNIAKEVKAQLVHVREWGAAFVTAVPELREEDAS
jgi:SAM-dependent methyltransferase